MHGKFVSVLFDRRTLLWKSMESSGRGKHSTVQLFNFQLKSSVAYSLLRSFRLSYLVFDHRLCSRYLSGNYCDDRNRESLQLCCNVSTFFVPAKLNCLLEFNSLYTMYPMPFWIQLYTHRIYDDDDDVDDILRCIWRMSHFLFRMPSSPDWIVMATMRSQLTMTTRYREKITHLFHFNWNSFFLWDKWGCCHGTQHTHIMT